MFYDMLEGVYLNGCIFKFIKSTFKFNDSLFESYFSSLFYEKETAFF